MQKAGRETTKKRKRNNTSEKKGKESNGKERTNTGECKERKGREMETKESDKGRATRQLHLAPYLGRELVPPCANEGASTLCPTCQANFLQNP